MKMIHEALRMFLALTALILTAMLVNPADEPSQIKRAPVAIEKAAPVKKTERHLASQDFKNYKGIRVAANRFRRF